MCIYVLNLLPCQHTTPGNMEANVWECNIIITLSLPSWTAVILVLSVTNNRPLWYTILHPHEVHSVNKCCLTHLTLLGLHDSWLCDVSWSVNWFASNIDGVKLKMMSYVLIMNFFLELNLSGEELNWNVTQKHYRMNMNRMVPLWTFSSKALMNIHADRQVHILHVCVGLAHACPNNCKQSAKNLLTVQGQEGAFPFLLLVSGKWISPLKLWRTPTLRLLSTMFNFVNSNGIYMDPWRSLTRSSANTTCDFERA